jgi:hypothetical protein
VRIALLDLEHPASFAGSLAARGHDVAVLGEPSSRFPRLPAARYYEDDLELVPQAMWRLARGSFDLAHAFGPALGWAAARAQRFGGPSFVFSLRGPLERRWLVDRHYRLEMLRATTAAAAVCVVDNADVASALRRYLLRDAEVVAPDAPADRYEAIYEACSRPS